MFYAQSTIAVTSGQFKAENLMTTTTTTIIIIIIIMIIIIIINNSYIALYLVNIYIKINMTIKKEQVL